MNAITLQAADGPAAQPVGLPPSCMHIARATAECACSVRGEDGRLLSATVCVLHYAHPSRPRFSSAHLS